MSRELSIPRLAGIIVFATLAAALFFTGPAVAEPQGFVIEAVMATPEADTPVEPTTLINIEDDGHILIITTSGRIYRQDGPYHGEAAEFLNKINDPEGGDVDHGILSSLLELAELSGKSTEQLGGVRGAESSSDIHTQAITDATKIYCFVAGVRPEFYTSKPPRRDEPIIMRFRAAPRSFYQSTWPRDVNTLSWPADWPAPEEGRYIWSLGSNGSVPVWLRLVDELPESPVRRAALYNDMRCLTQAIALIRELLSSAKPL